MVYTIFLMKLLEKKNSKEDIIRYDSIDKVTIDIVNEQNRFLVRHRLHYMKNEALLMIYLINK